MTATTLGIIATAINVVCAFLYVFAPRRHRHRYSSWSGWTISQSLSGAEGVRYRHCGGCQKVEKQATGWHRCIEASDRKPCTHLGFLSESEITRLEKELGL